jgi:hypothetical protein
VFRCSYSLIDQCVGGVSVEVLAENSGLPISGAICELLQVVGSPVETKSVAFALTNELGIARISGVGIGSGLVGVQADGYAPVCRSVDVRVPVSSPLRVLLSEPWTISGRLLDIGGDPVRGSIQCLPLQDWQQILATRIGIAATMRDYTQVDGDGRFQITNLARQAYVISLVQPQGKVAPKYYCEPVVVEPVAGRAVAEVDLYCSEGVPVKLVPRLRVGETVSVWVETLAGTVVYNCAFFSGILPAQLSLAPGTYELKVAGRDCERQSKTIFVVPEDVEIEFGACSL